MFSRRTFVYKSIEISKYKIQNSKKFVNLLDNLNGDKDIEPIDKRPVTHLLAQMSLSTMYNKIKFNIKQVPGEIINDVVLNDKNEYLPISFINRLAIRDEHYFVLTNIINQMNKD